MTREEKIAELINNRTRQKVRGMMAKNNTCETCKELNEEAIDSVSISEIYIMGAGYYNYHRTISFCPTCGKRIVGKKKRG